MSSALAVSESVFGVVIHEQPLQDAAPSRRSKPPGPGLPESVAWGVGYLVLQFGSLILSFVVLGVILGLKAGMRNEPPPDFSNPGAMEVQLATVASSVLGLLTLIGLGWWRLGRSAPRRLNLALPTLKQTVILVTMVVPLMLVSGTAFRMVQSALQWLMANLPWLAATNQVNGVPYIENQIAQLPLLLSLFSVAVLPAIGEEFLCRGLIGRGLVARWGVVRGVLLTSLLFGMLHLYPPHMASAFVLGITVHVIYLATRSFWAPVLYHFLNNATVIVMSSAAVSGAATEQFGAPSGWLVAIALAYVVFALTMLWRYRTVYRNEEGREVDPAYPTVAAPRRETALVRTARKSRLAFGFFSLTAALIVGGLSIVATSARGTESTRQAGLTDEQISERLVGTWDSGTRFNADGTFASTGTIDGEDAPTVIRGTWNVSNGVLRASVTESESPQIQPGNTMYWEVLSIDETACEYRISGGETIQEHRVTEPAAEPIAKGA